MLVSRSTINRWLLTEAERTLADAGPLGAASTVTRPLPVIGIDDGAWKKGQR